MELKIYYEDIVSIITVFQSNAWRNSFMSDENLEGHPNIKVVHDSDNKKFLMLTVDPDKIKNPASDHVIFDNFFLFTKNRMNFIGLHESTTYLYLRK
jgi:hypothetical protein